MHGKRAVGMGMLCLALSCLAGCAPDVQESIPGVLVAESTGSGSAGAQETQSSETETQMELEDMEFPYDYLWADDPRAQTLVANGWEGGFTSYIVIRGLADYSPRSSSQGGLESYAKDTEIVIEDNVGEGLLQSERLAEVKESMREMFIDIFRNKGGNIGDYQKYFSDEAMAEETAEYAKNALKEDWILLEGFSLCDYAGNSGEFWWDWNTEATRLTETEGHYNFQFLFYADYRAMGYGEDESAAAVAIACAVSKETGLIEEMNFYQWDITRYDFEISRW